MPGTALGHARGRSVGAWGAALLILWLLAPEATAARLRRPFNVSVGVNYGFDNYGGSGCDDYQCGGVCYDGHSGTDFPLGFGTTIVAAASGQVVSRYNGCANTGYLGNTCGGRCGNYVQIEHNDGTRTLYCHMRLNSITVSLWQWVSCGQILGQSASSGSSTGNHLHLGYRVGGVNRDPFAGPCSQGTSWWMGQGSYPNPIPSTACETNCACTPGQSQSQGCGNCGTRSRSCGSNCQWGGWSSCAGQGPCSPGQVESHACCDCGTESRSCAGNCQWNGWSACSGPDPSNGAECDTGEPGPCASGRMRCQSGCLACVRLVDPAPERCDDVDNDCDAVVDNNSPVDMGDPPPAFAARLVDWSAPTRMAPGSRGAGWVVFENVGLETWPAGAIWLGALVAIEGAPSALHDPGTWPAHDVLTRLTVDVPPGGYAELFFDLRLSEAARGLVTERFQLLGPTGALIRCPAAILDLSVAPGRSVNADPTEPSDPPAAPGPADLPQAKGGCGCASGGEAPPSAGLVVLILLGLLSWRRFRSGRFSASALAVLLLLGTSCDSSDAPPASSQAKATRSAQPKLSPARVSDSALVAARDGLADSTLEVLDAAEDGSVVLGRAHPAPARITAWRRFDGFLRDASGFTQAVPGTTGWIQQVRFAPGDSGRVALLRGQGELVLWNVRTGATTTVDQDVLVGISWSPSGEELAYVGGQVPRMGLYRFDLRTGARHTVVPPGSPLALPVFSPDGTRLAFASARGGIPALWVVDRSGRHLRQLTNRGSSAQALRRRAGRIPMPEGWRPPVWRETVLVYEAAGGVYAVDIRTGALRWQVPDARRPHLGTTGRVVVRRRSSRFGWSTVEIP